MYQLNADNSQVLAVSEKVDFRIDIIPPPGTSMDLSMELFGCDAYKRTAFALIMSEVSLGPKITSTKGDTIQPKESKSESLPEFVSGNCRPLSLASISNFLLQ